VHAHAIARLEGRNAAHLGALEGVDYARHKGVVRSPRAQIRREPRGASRGGEW
jgi:hypothetical protein